MLHNFCNEDYCDFEADPEVSCFLTEDLADDGDWIRNTVNIIKHVLELQLFLYMVL